MFRLDRIPTSHMGLRGHYQRVVSSDCRRPGTARDPLLSATCSCHWANLLYLHYSHDYYTAISLCTMIPFRQHHTHTTKRYALHQTWGTRGPKSLINNDTIQMSSLRSEATAHHFGGLPAHDCSTRRCSLPSPSHNAEHLPLDGERSCESVCRGLTGKPS